MAKLKKITEFIWLVGEGGLGLITPVRPQVNAYLKL